MLVYRSHENIVNPKSAWPALVDSVKALGSAASLDDLVAVAIELGELEAAIADRLSPDRDGLDPLLADLRQASLVAGRILTASVAGRHDHVQERIRDLLLRVTAISPTRLPSSLAVRTPEGFAFYALQPQAYAAAAARFAHESHAERVVCIGIRSIGTILSGVVAAELHDRGIHVELYTVRPRGHPFDRVTLLDDQLSARLTGQPRETSFLIVDEGPGLSGSSMTSVAVVLTQLGIATDKIVLFPGWDADGSTFQSAFARSVWQRHHRYTPGSEDLPVNGEFLTNAVDVSAGRWRTQVYRSEMDWPASHPQHEMRKFWLRDQGLTIRFAGLGKYGRRKFERAAVLAEAGVGPPPVSLRSGYLSLPLIAGEPCTGAAVQQPLLNALASYLSVIARAFPAGDMPDRSHLDDMIDVNTREALGEDAGAVLRRLDRVRQCSPSSAVALDGRMLPHEWVRGPTGFVKVDALDHHADHFFPGSVDIAWDLAAAAIEFRLPPQGVEYLVNHYERASGDRHARSRLPYYSIAWLAFRTGYATLARDSLAGTAEAQRFQQLIERYTELLRSSQ
jgi:hypothetical protein